MRSFFRELKRRNVYRAVAFYAAAGWLLVQIATQVFPVFDLPNWTMRLVVTAVIVGFPVATWFAWYYEWTPEGLKRESELAPGGSVTRNTGRTFDRWIVAVLALAVVVLVANQFVPHKYVSAAPEKSIAVLPFADMSQGRNEEYFSDGMAEELLDLLAKVPELHVAGRTSAFAFKGKDDDLRVIGQKLNVASVLEGSVRRSGDKVRITTQLINVADGYHLWSETYDRQMTDVFAVQDEIAAAVVAALKIRLLPQQHANAAQHRSANPQAYDQYLLGRQYFSRVSAEDVHLAVAAYEKAIALDPGFAAAFAGLASAEQLIGAAYSATHEEKERWLEKARVASHTALELDPQLEEGFAARGYLRLLADWDIPGAQADLLRAIALNPGDSFALKWYARSLASTGRLAEAIAQMKKAASLDPLNGIIWANLGLFYVANGQMAEARQAFDKSQEILPKSGDIFFSIGVTHLLEGNAAEALIEFQRAEPGRPHRALCGRALAEYDLGQVTESQHALDALIKERAQIDPYSVATVYAWRGEKDNAFEWLERAYVERVGYMVDVAYDPLLRKLRDDPRYHALLQKMAMLPDGSQARQ